MDGVACMVLVAGLNVFVSFAGMGEMLLSLKSSGSYIGFIFMMASQSFVVMPITDNQERCWKMGNTAWEPLPTCFFFDCFLLLMLLACLTVFTIVLSVERKVCCLEYA